MNDPHTSSYLAEYIAEARAHEAMAAILAPFAAIEGALAARLEMKNTIAAAEAARRDARAAIEGAFAATDEAMQKKLARRLVERDALMSACGHREWLSDALRSVTQRYNMVLADHADEKASLSQCAALRTVLAATREAMHILGRPIEQHEKQHKTRTASRPFRADDYPCAEVRRAIVLTMFENDAGSAAFLEDQLYRPDRDRDGRIAAVLDAWRGEDAIMKEQALRLAAEILAADHARYTISSAASAGKPSPLPLSSVGERARELAGVRP